MNKGSTGLEESGSATRACAFIPSTHRGLPMLRLFLPFRDPSRDESENIVRWSRYVSLEDHSASLDWFEATAEIAEDEPSIRGLVSCMGELDEETANALRDAIGTVKLQCPGGWATRKHHGPIRQGEYSGMNTSRHTSVLTM